MIKKGPKYVAGDKWYAGSKCNRYEKGTKLKILKVIGFGRKKYLHVADEKGNDSKISCKVLWKKCKKSA